MVRDVERQRFIIETIGLLINVVPQTGTLQSVIHDVRQSIQALDSIAAIVPNQTKQKVLPPPISIDYELQKKRYSEENKTSTAECSKQTTSYT
jgi:hypothetical protein